MIIKIENFILLQILNSKKSFRINLYNLFSKNKILVTLLVFTVLFGGIFYFQAQSSTTTYVSGPITSDTTWTLANSPYVVQGDVSIQEGVTLTIQPGVVIKFDSFYSSLKVYGNLLSQGIASQPIYFTSFKDDEGGDTNGDGSATQPAPGDWDSLYFYADSNSNITHSIIRYASFNRPYYNQGAVVVNGGTLDISDSHITSNRHNINLLDGNLTLTNSEIDHSSQGLYQTGGTATISQSSFHDNSYGIFSLEGTLILTSNNFQNNNNTIIVITAVDFTHSGNLATNNQVNGIGIWGTLTKDQTWTPDLIPYVVFSSLENEEESESSLIIPQNITLTIQPGIVVKFYHDTSSLEVYGTLNAQGTASQPIYFTSFKDDTVGGDTNGDGSATQPTPGDWSSLYFYSGSDSNLSHSTIRYAGHHWPYPAGRPVGGVVIEDGTLDISDSHITSNRHNINLLDGNLTLTNSEIDHSSQGLYQTGGTATISQSSFHDNSYGVFSSEGTLILTSNNFQDSNNAITVTTAVDFTHSDNSATNNQVNGIGIWGTLTKDQTWTPDLIPYVVFSSPEGEEESEGSIVIPQNITLTIQPQVVIKLYWPTSAFEIYGTLNAQGTASQPIYFTSFKDDTVGGDTNGDGSATQPTPGDWSSLYFYSGSDSNLSHSTIRYAGHHWPYPAGRPVGGVVIEDGTLDISDSHITSNRHNINLLDGNLTLTNSEIDHSSQGLYQTGGTATISQSSFHDLTYYGVYNYAPTNTDARNNWWGDPSGPYHPTLNPEGLGVRVSDRVDFIPWLDYDPTKIQPFNVAVILAEPANVPHDFTAQEYQPCKLLLKKLYPFGYSKEYYQDLTYCVTDYHKENSFETINLDFEIFDNNGQWFKTDKNEKDYLGRWHEFVIDAINLAVDKGIDLSDKDIVVVVYSGEVRAHTWPPKTQPLGYPPYKIIVAEEDLVGTWSHEVGHIIGALLTPENTIIPDLYKMGLSSVFTLFGERYDILHRGAWDVMAEGSLNNGGNNPPYMSSYTKEFLEWLNYDIHPKSAYGDEYWINSLETSKLGDTVFRYNLSDDVKDESPKYYILEARNRNLRTWDSSLPEDKALVLYRVDTKGYEEYDYAPDGIMNNQHRKISIPFFDGILTPDGDSHLDIANLVCITAVSDEQTADIYRIKSKIEKVGYSFFEDRFRGVVLDPLSRLYQKIIHYFPFYSPQILASTSIDLNNSNSDIKTRGQKVEAPPCPSSYERYIIGEIQSINTEPSSVQNLRNLHRPRGLESRYVQVKISKAGSLTYFIGLEEEWVRRENKELVGEVREIFMEEPFINRWSLKKGDKILILPNNCTNDIKMIYVTNLKGVVRLLWVLLVFCIFIGLLVWSFIKVFRRWKWKGVIIFGIITVILLLLLIFIGFFLLIAGPSNIPVKNNSRIIQSQSPPLYPTILPDLDLHLYTEDGRHIGMNYETGEYEIQIPGAIVSGDNRDAPEWIFVPPDVTNYHFVVSSYDNQKFLEENPEIAQELEDTTDGYEVYARYIDPETAIYTSTIISEDIEPAEELEHPITGTADITILPAIPWEVPKFLKETSITKLVEAKTGDKKIDKEIDKIVKHIQKSLDNKLWINGLHLDSKHGKKVFHKERAALKRMQKEIKKKKIPAELKETLKEVIDKLVKADEMLAKVAIEDAKLTPVQNPKNQKKVDHKIEKAEKELAKAYEELEKDKPDKAIKRFEKTWKHAQAAIKTAKKESKTLQEIGAQILNKFRIQGSNQKYVLIGILLSCFGIVGFFTYGRKPKFLSNIAKGIKRISNFKGK